MSYENGSGGGGCLSALLTLLLLPYIIAIYGYALLAIMVILIIEWLQEHIQTILLYGLPVLTAVVLIKTGLVSKLYQRVMAKRLKVRVFTPSTNLYCYWCTRKLGLQSWERHGKYYCQDCYEKGRS